MPTLRPSRPQDAERVIDLWRRAVDATHDFLDAGDRQAIEADVRACLPQAPLLLAVDAQDMPLAFMWVVEGHMEALFVDPDHHGRGLGRRLVEHALRGHPRLSTDVNAQNRQARAFYARMGFEETGHSPVDGQGRPYPLVHLRHVPAAQAEAADDGRGEADVRWMRHALALAERAQREFDEIPVGAVLVAADGQVLGEGWNLNIAQHDPSAHAEIVALRAAGARRGNHRLSGCTLYVTLEPCAMCAMALVHARVARVVYAASDPKTGACGSVFDLLGDPRHNHRVEIDAGLLAQEAGLRLRNYFRAKRGRPLLPDGA